MSTVNQGNSGQNINQKSPTKYENGVNIPIVDTSIAPSDFNGIAIDSVTGNFVHGVSGVWIDTLINSKNYTDAQFAALQSGTYPAIPTTNPTIAPYIGKYSFQATIAGTYTSFSGIVVSAADVAVGKEAYLESFDSGATWTKRVKQIVDTTGFALSGGSVKTLKEVDDSIDIKIGYVGLPKLESNIETCSTPTSTGGGSRTYIFNQPVPVGKTVSKIRLNIGTAGTISICEYSISGGNAVRINATDKVVSVGINEFTNIPISPGNYLGIIQTSGSLLGRVNVDATAATGYGTYIYTSIVSTTPVVLPALVTNTRFGAQYILSDASTVNYRLLAAESEINDLQADVALLDANSYSYNGNPPTATVKEDYPIGIIDSSTGVIVNNSSRRYSGKIAIPKYVSKIKVDNFTQIKTLCFYDASHNPILPVITNFTNGAEYDKPENAIEFAVNIYFNADQANYSTLYFGWVNQPRFAEEWEVRGVVTIDELFEENSHNYNTATDNTNITYPLGVVDSTTGNIVSPSDSNQKRFSGRITLPPYVESVKMKNFTAIKTLCFYDESNVPILPVINNFINDTDILKPSNATSFAINICYITDQADYSTLFYGYENQTIVSQGRPLPFFGKNGISIGHSITEFGDYTNIIEQRTGANWIKAGFGACMMGSYGSATPVEGYYDKMCMHSIADMIASGDFSALITAANNLFTATGDDNRPQAALLDSVDWSTISYLTIGYGSNDHARNLPLGTTADTTPATFRGAINYVVNKIQTVYPLMKIMFMSDYQRCYYSSFPTTMTGTTDTVPNAGGKYLIEYVDATKDTSEKNSLPTLDMYRNSGLNVYTNATLTYDGVHPSSAGYTNIGNTLSSFIVAHF